MYCTRSSGACWASFPASLLSAFRPSLLHPGGKHLLRAPNADLAPAQADRSGTVKRPLEPSLNSCATGSLHLIWDIADTLNGLMAVPNLIGVLASLPLLLRLQREFFTRASGPRG